MRFIKHPATRVVLGVIAFYGTISSVGIPYIEGAIMTVAVTFISWGLSS